MWLFMGTVILVVYNAPASSSDHTASKSKMIRWIMGRKFDERSDHSVIVGRTEEDRQNLSQNGRSLWWNINLPNTSEECQTLDREVR